MDNVKNYENSDFETIQHWYKKRGVEFNDRTLLPSIGFMVPDIGAGFIYITDSSIAFIEGYITNPDSSKEDRDNALNKISSHLIGYAKCCNVKFIKCETKVKAIENRAINFGFESLGSTISMVREL